MSYVIGGVLIALSLSIYSFTATAAVISTETNSHEKLHDNRLTLKLTGNGLLVKSRLCELSPLVKSDLLLRSLKKVSNSQRLLNRYEDLMCKVTSNGSKKEVLLRELPDVFGEKMLFGSVSYSGIKNIGDWSCVADQQRAKPEQISFFGSLISTKVVSLFRINSPTAVDIWVAPFENSPRNAKTLSFVWQSGDWFIDGICDSTRI